MVGKRVFLLFASGVLLTGIGFFIGRSANQTQSISDSESILPSVTSIAQTQDRKDSISGKVEVLVTKVFDGDTLQIETGEKIRYVGINAPEKGEQFSKEATELNKQLVLGKNIDLEFDVGKKDRYGRTLAYVFVGNLFINQELVEEGLVVSTTIQPNVRYQKEILEAQKKARESCVGMWKSLCGN